MWWWCARRPRRGHNKLWGALGLGRPCCCVRCRLRWRGTGIAADKHADATLREHVPCVARVDLFEDEGDVTAEVARDNRQGVAPVLHARCDVVHKAIHNGPCIVHRRVLCDLLCCETLEILHLSLTFSRLWVREVSCFKLKSVFVSSYFFPSREHLITLVLCLMQTLHTQHTK